MHFEVVKDYLYVYLVTIAQIVINILVRSVFSIDFRSLPQDERNTLCQTIA